MENPFHKYKDIIGKPGEGAHSYRFLGFAVVDTVTVIIVALLVAWYFKWNVWYTLAAFFISGVLIHRLFGVRSTVDKLIFG
jgi:hypothetical protein